MSWIICAVLTVALMAMSIRLYFNKEKGVSRILFVLGCLFAATYIIYVPVFQTEHGILPGLIGNFVHVLRVVTIDADVTQYYPTVIAQLNNEVFSQAYIILMGILHICLPKSQ